MCCNLCRSHHPSSQWATKGVTVADQSSLSRHELSDGHSRARDIAAGSKGLSKSLKNVAQVIQKAFMHAQYQQHGLELGAAAVV